MVTATKIGGMPCGCETSRGCTGKVHISHCDLHGGYRTNNYSLIAEQLERLVEDAKKHKRKTIKLKDVQRILLSFHLDSMDIFSRGSGF